MVTESITFKYPTCISSCLPGETGLQTGEEVIFELKPKNPLWSTSIKATVTLIANIEGGRQYTFEYDVEDLNGGPFIEDCDVTEIRCYSCCDANAERLNNLISALVDGGLITENEDGTFNYIQP